jgi:hypothetical protein
MLAMVLTWLLTLFFAIAAVLNFIEPPQIRAQFKKWGFPGWFHCAVMVGVIVSISGGYGFSIQELQWLPSTLP